MVEGQVRWGGGGTGSLGRGGAGSVGSGGGGTAVKFALLVTGLKPPLGESLTALPKDVLKAWKVVDDLQQKEAIIVSLTNLRAQSGMKVHVNNKRG